MRKTLPETMNPFMSVYVLIIGLRTLVNITIVLEIREIMSKQLNFISRLVAAERRDFTVHHGRCRVQPAHVAVHRVRFQLQLCVRRDDERDMSSKRCHTLQGEY